MLLNDSKLGYGAMTAATEAGRKVTRRVEPDGQLANVRKQLVVTERWDARVEEWRSNQRPLPTWSEAVRILVERALDDEARKPVEPTPDA